MSFRLFDAPEREPSSFVGYAGNVIDRRSEQRGDDSVVTALADPKARIMLLRGGRACLKVTAEGFDPWYAVAEAMALGARLEHAVLLGWDGRGAVLAAPGGLDPEALPDNIKAIDYRSIHVQGLLGAEDIGALAQGAALLAWHSTHRFCGRCGQPTAIAAGGYKRRLRGLRFRAFPGHRPGRDHAPR